MNIQTPAFETPKLSDGTLIDARCMLQHAAESALVAYYAASDGAQGYHINSMMASFKDAAAALGFDLVPRLTPQQHHDAQLARRVAEDGDEF